jgi:antirestriction protein
MTNTINFDLTVTFMRLDNYRETSLNIGEIVEDQDGALDLFYDFMEGHDFDLVDIECEAFRLSASDCWTVEKAIATYNTICEIMEEYDDDAPAIFDAIDQHRSRYDSISDIYESHEFRIYTECWNMADVAFEIVEECGMLESMPESLRNYFDYAAYGRDLDIEGNFYDTGNGIFVEIIR